MWPYWKQKWKSINKQSVFNAAVYTDKATKDKKLTKMPICAIWTVDSLRKSWGLVEGRTSAEMFLCHFSLFNIYSDGFYLLLFLRLKAGTSIGQILVADLTYLWNNLRGRTSTNGSRGKCWESLKSQTVWFYILHVPTPRPERSNIVQSVMTSKL